MYLDSSTGAAGQEEQFDMSSISDAFPWLWSRNPSNFGWVESEPTLLGGGVEVGAWNLGSGSVALVCVASELYK